LGMDGLVLNFTNGFLQGTITVAFEPPNYVLVEVTNPQGSTYIQHAWKGHNIPTLLAKLTLFPAYKQDRLPVVPYIFNGGRGITTMRIRILNPDHSLFQFHGRNWSGSIVFVVYEQGGASLCS